jgi:hypothetical protein
VGLRGDRLEQFFQGQQAAMHIAERDQPGGGVGGGRPAAKGSLGRVAQARPLETDGNRRRAR